MSAHPSASAARSAPAKPPSIFGVLKPYRAMVALLVLLSIAGNAVTLALPALIARGIDAYTAGTLVLRTVTLEFLSAAVFIFLFTYLQSVVQTFASERVARDLRSQLIAKISRQHYRYIEEADPARLLTNLTSDVDSIKMFVAQAIVSLVSSAVIIVGAAALLLSIDWRLALAVLAIIPVIGGTFFLVLQRVRKFFVRSREIIDWLNKIINESILGAALIRVINSQKREYEKFTAANSDALGVGLSILRLFSLMIPTITFVASMGTLTVVALGGYFVISGSLSLGSFAAFNSYIMILIFPIIVIGFMSNIIAQAGASYGRISAVLQAPDVRAEGTVSAALTGALEARGLVLYYGERAALRNVSFSVRAGTKTAIIGPTAAGKTQLLYVLTGLMVPQEGTVRYNGHPLGELQSESFYRQVGLVFQDSSLFNMSVRENIAFSDTVTDASLKKAVDAAELSDFLAALPEGLDTVVSERGTSLSGGQKQRIMLARALALDPKILFLDDFTARVDADTERRILANMREKYPDLTLISVTQKISSIEHYDQILLLMEGEILASGTHEELLRNSPEYVQIYESQRSTSHYEVRA